MVLQSSGAFFMWRFPHPLLMLAFFAATISCQTAPYVKQPSGTVIARGEYGPEDGSFRDGGIPIRDYSSTLQRGDLRVNRLLEYETLSTWMPPASNPSVRTVYRAGEIVASVIDREFQLGFRPGWEILMVHTVENERTVIAGKTNIANGLFAGFPLLDGQLTPQNLSYLVTALAHEYAETLLGSPDVLGCALYSGSLHNRWAAEGIAELVTSFCEIEIRADGIQVADRQQEGLRPSRKWEMKNVNLEDWLVAWQGWPDSRPAELIDANLGERDLRYLAAEYVAWLWYRGAIKQGLDFPIARFAAWTSRFPSGPAYSEVVQWMETTSGEPLFWLLKEVPVSQVLKYHRNKTRILSGKKGLREGSHP